MRHIVDILNEQGAQMPEETPVKPTEVAQIVISWKDSAPALIMRYGRLKPAEASYVKLAKQWMDLYDVRRADKAKNIVEVSSDMFCSYVNLHGVASISLVDHVVRAKFIPA